jgi:propionate catabolism operon transcriptional regulator
VICTGDTIQLDDLPAAIAAAARAPEPPPRGGRRASPLEEAEAETLRLVLARCGGNRSRAAKELSISRNTLWRKLRGRS